MSQNTETIAVGQELKRIREQRGWTLEAAAKVTRIRADQLELIEQDRLDEFPSQSYVRGFIRIYSKALGLNPDIVMSHVEKRPDAPRFTEDEETNLFLDIPNRPREMEAVVGLDDRAQEWGSKLMAGLVALVLIAIVVVVYNTMQNSSPRSITIARDATLPQEDLPVVPREKLHTPVRSNPASLNQNPMNNTTADNPVVVPPAAVIKIPTQDPNLTQKPQTNESTLNSLTPTTNTASLQMIIARPPLVRLTTTSPDNSTEPTNSSAQEQTAFSSTPPETNIQTLPNIEEPFILPENFPVNTTAVATPVNRNVEVINVVNGRVVRVPSQPSDQMEYPESLAQNDTASRTQNVPDINSSVLDEDFVVLDEVVIPEEEVTLEGDRLDAYQARIGAALRSTSSSQNGQVVLPAVRVNGTRGAIPRAVPVTRTNLPNTQSITSQNSPITPLEVSTLTVGPDEFLNETHVAPAGPTNTDHYPHHQTQNHPHPSQQEENLLRMELNREAFVRVFVNDTASQPALDEVLPAGSAASWQGRRFTVTIRPADAAVFYLNGQRYDFSDRGSENITLQFP